MSLKKLTLQSSVWLGALAVVASAAGCGGSDGLSPDALAPYRQQTLQWSPCDTTILAEPEAKYRERWAQLGDRLRCTTMRAPMDWAKPERSDVFISVMRVAAADPAQRLGALVFNPGGPGADGLVQTLRLINAFDQSNPQSQQGALQLRLLASYDMVGFSPRGSGASTRLQCATNELQRFVAQSPNAQSDGNLANLTYNDRKIAEACLRGPLTPYINTDAIARDMDLLRELLGEDKLNYVGYSYGTWLGGWYASLFPSKTGRMVLDSAQDMTASHEAALVSMAPARQRLHDDVLLPYAVRHQQYFQLGSSAADINAMLHALSPPVQDVLVRAVDEQVSRSDHADDYLATLGAARGLDAVLRTLPDPADQAAVNAALQQQVFITGHSAYDQAVRTQAQALYQNYRSLFVQPAPRSLQLDDYFAPYWAVSCNDTAASASAAAWNATVRSTALQAPLFFGGFLVGLTQTP